MNVEYYIREYMDIITTKEGMKAVIVKGTNLFHYIPISDNLNDDYAKFLAEHEITEFGSMWDKEDSEYIPVDFGYSKKENKWFIYAYGKYMIFDTKQEVIDWYDDLNKRYLAKFE